MQGALTDQYAGRLFSNNYGWTSIGVLIWFIMSAAVILAGFFTYGSEMGGLALFANAFATVGALIATGSLLAWLTGTSGFLWGLLGSLFGGAFAIAGVAVGLGGAQQYCAGSYPAAAGDRITVSDVLLSIVASADGRGPQGHG